MAKNGRMMGGIGRAMARNGRMMGGICRVNTKCISEHSSYADIQEGRDLTP